MGRYVALLRGINVGGKNPIGMPQLKACFEDLGFEDVRTYIQSGQVVFGTSERSGARLIERIEQGLTACFGHYQASVVVLSASQMRKVVEGAPKGYGTRPDTYRYDVWYLKPPLKAAAAVKEVPIKEGVDTVVPGPGVLYTSRLTAKATQSRLSKIVGSPIYRSITIRNWNTTNKLVELVGG